MLADGMSGELTTQIRALLSTERNGHQLGEGLIDNIVTYLIDVCEFKKVSEVVVEDLETIAVAAWAENLPSKMCARMTVRCV